jgi:hypothetical protein
MGLKNNEAFFILSYPGKVSRSNPFVVRFKKNDTSDLKSA